MIIQPTSLAALAWAGAASGSAAESWRIGTVLSARPLGINPDGMMVLQIGALTVETEAPTGPGEGCEAGGLNDQSRLLEDGATYARPALP